jgi:hypothetical protein
VRMKDDFDPAVSLPRFLAVQAEPDFDDAPERAPPVSRVFKASILVAAASVICIGVLATGNPVALLAEMSASLLDDASPQPAPAIQTVTDTPVSVPAAADAQALPSTATDALSHTDIAASEPASKDQAGNGETSSDALFKQFQAWAADQDTQGRAGPAQPVQDAPVQLAQNAPAQTAPAPAAENAPAPYRLAKKRRHVRAVHDARAEMRRQDLRRQARRAQPARAERPARLEDRPPVQDARAQVQTVQETQAPSFLQTFGFRN